MNKHTFDFQCTTYIRRRTNSMQANITVGLEAQSHVEGWNDTAIPHKLTLWKEGRDRTGLYAGTLLAHPSFLLVGENGANCFSGRIHLHPISTNVTLSASSTEVVLEDAPFANENVGTSVSIDPSTDTPVPKWLATGAPAWSGYLGKVILFRSLTSSSSSQPMQWQKHQELVLPSGLQEWGDAFGKEVAFSPTSRYLAVAFGHNDNEHTAVFLRTDKMSARTGEVVASSFSFHAVFRDRQFLQWTGSDRLFLWNANTSIQVATFRDRANVALRTVLFANELQCAHTNGHLMQLERIHFNAETDRDTTITTGTHYGVLVCSVSIARAHQWVQKRYRYYDVYADKQNVSMSASTSTALATPFFVYHISFDTLNPHVFYTEQLTNYTHPTRHARTVLSLNRDVVLIGERDTLSLWRRGNASRWMHTDTLFFENRTQSVGAGADTVETNAFMWYTAVATAVGSRVLWVGVPTANQLRGRLYFWDGWEKVVGGVGNDTAGTSSEGGVVLLTEHNSTSIAMFLILSMVVIFALLFGSYMCVMCGCCVCCRETAGATDKKKKKKEEEEEEAYSPYKVASYAGYTELDDEHLLPTPPRPPHTDYPHRSTARTSNEKEKEKEKEKKAYVPSPVQIATFRSKKEIDERKGASKETIVTYKT